VHGPGVSGTRMTWIVPTDFYGGISPRSPDVSMLIFLWLFGTMAITQRLIARHWMLWWPQDVEQRISRCMGLVSVTQEPLGLCSPTFIVAYLQGNRMCRWLIFCGCLAQWLYPVVGSIYTPLAGHLKCVGPWETSDDTHTCSSNQSKKIRRISIRLRPG
jgi:hypothetical protein